MVSKHGWLIFFILQMTNEKKKKKENYLGCNFWVDSVNVGLSCRILWSQTHGISYFPRSQDVAITFCHSIFV